MLIVLSVLFLINSLDIRIIYLLVIFEYFILFKFLYSCFDFIQKPGKLVYILEYKTGLFIIFQSVGDAVLSKLVKKSINKSQIYGWSSASWIITLFLANKFHVLSGWSQPFLCDNFLDFLIGRLIILYEEKLI